MYHLITFTRSISESYVVRSGLLVLLISAVDEHLAISTLLTTSLKLFVFTGIQILVVTLPNYVWTMQSTAVEIAEIQLMLRGSRKAVVGGFFFTLIYTSSLYHLLLISIQRFIAVQRPLLYKVLGNKSTYWAIACVWIMSMIVSSVPGKLVS